MAREVRRVPPDWRHPEENGAYVPLHNGAEYEARLARWDEEAAQWDNGLIRNYGPEGGWQPRDNDVESETYAEYAGDRPVAEEYMPRWTSEEATHVMMYEDTSEGTPISPAFATVEELARWLAETKASAFGDMTATYEQWLATCRRGWAISLAIFPKEGRTIPGVAME